MQRVLAATDGSEGADRAILVAVEVAKAINGRLLILTVSTDEFTDEQIRSIESAGMTEGNALEAISRGILKRAEECAREAGARSVETRLAVGDPATKIIDAVRRDNVDMLVVGRRGRGRLEGLILGSVSQKLAALAPCIVTIVP